MPKLSSARAVRAKGVPAVVALGTLRKTSLAAVAAVTATVLVPHDQRGN